MKDFFKMSEALESAELEKTRKPVAEKPTEDEVAEQMEQEQEQESEVETDGNNDTDL